MHAGNYHVLIFFFTVCTCSVDICFLEFQFNLEPLFHPPSFVCVNTLPPVFLPARL